MSCPSQIGPKQQIFCKMPSFLAPLRVPPARGKILDPPNLALKVYDIALLGSGGEISFKNAI